VVVSYNFPVPDRVNPSSQTVPVKSATCIHCYSSTPVRWFFKGKELPQRTHLPRNTLGLPYVRNSDGGKYRCQGSAEGGYSFLATAVIYVSCESLHAFQ